MFSAKTTFADQFHLLEGSSLLVTQSGDGLAYVDEKGNKLNQEIWNVALKPIVASQNRVVADNILGLLFEQDLSLRNGRVLIKPCCLSPRKNIVSLKLTLIGDRVSAVLLVSVPRTISDQQVQLSWLEGKSVSAKARSSVLGGLSWTQASLSLENPVNMNWLNEGLEKNVESLSFSDYKIDLTSKMKIDLEAQLKLLELLKTALKR